MSPKHRTMWLILAAVILVAGIGALYYYANHSAPGSGGSGGVACTQEAKLCPDGSYVGRTGPNCEFAACPSVSPSPTPDTSAWKTYTSKTFGLSIKYPPNWRSSGDVLSVVNPHVFFGNPLSGLQVYPLRLFIYNNPQNLSAEDYVKQMLAQDEAEDASNSAAGPAPRLTPQFDKQYATMVGSYPAWELYHVFEFDEHSEQIYVQQNKQMIVFDFPVPDTNPNLSSPAANNVVAHEIVNTLTLDPNVWKFCGGIAGLQCAAGYSCVLDGNYPDAGGHCATMK